MSLCIALTLRAPLAQASCQSAGSDVTRAVLWIEMLVACAVALWHTMHMYAQDRAVSPAAKRLCATTFLQTSRRWILTRVMVA